VSCPHTVRVQCADLVCQVVLFLWKPDRFRSTDLDLQPPWGCLPLWGVSQSLWSCGVWQAWGGLLRTYLWTSSELNIELCWQQSDFSYQELEWLTYRVIKVYRRLNIFVTCWQSLSHIVSERLKGLTTRHVPYCVSVEQQDSDHDPALSVSDFLKKTEPMIFYTCQILLLYMYNYIAGYSLLLFIIYY
jgi:hypothetical protein